MAERRKVLLLDDEQEALDMYRDLLKQIPSQPAIHSCTSGAHAIARLESEPFSLLITDLNMPKMDGMQVLSIVRRRFPQVRVIVLTSVMDEEFRARAYAMGVDLFWQKPTSINEAKLLQESVESLLTKETTAGFRGIQSKSLVDLIQLECMSSNSCVLRITHGVLEGKIWIQEGEVIDAATGNLTGEAAFQDIFSWKAGHFEVFPADPGRTRRISVPYQGLLLDTAQAIDESKTAPSLAKAGFPPTARAVGEMAKGVSFALVVPADEKAEPQKWGGVDAVPTAAWARLMQQRLRVLGDKLGVGEMAMLQARGGKEQVSFSPADKQILCLGFQSDLTVEQAYQTTKQILAKWAS